ncbi:hypothetical protein BDW74DRAFT_164607 [Aspergillus multicolor]|uniref:putative amino acid permease n=1 Tax=Aspergillus multicolor TaxID=41759 RepID=UPI003CCCB517
MDPESLDKDGDGDGDVSPGTITNLGYEAVLHTRRSTPTLIFQSLAIAAPPFAIGTTLVNASYGGGPLALFVGWLIVTVLAECVAVSVAELASRYPTSAGPYYWSFQIATTGKAVVSYITGWIWVIGNWTTALGVNFGFAQLIAGAVTMYDSEWTATPWQLLLILWFILLVILAICVFGHRYLHVIDTICAAWTALILIVFLIALLVTADNGRHGAQYAFSSFDSSISGWGNFSFFIGLLPAAYTFSTVGMLSSMAEETTEPAIAVPRAISLAVPTLGLSGLLFIIPLCFTLPPLQILIASPYGQPLPVLFKTVMGSNAGGLALLLLILILTIFCSISVTTAASRCTWAFARDKALPVSWLWYRVTPSKIPLNALLLVTGVQALLGLINLGSTSAFTAFVSVGVMGVSVSYLIPVVISLVNRRAEVNRARFNCGHLVGTLVNTVAVAWILFQVVLFSMPVAVPTSQQGMNYASVVLVGFGVIAAGWYAAHARKSYKGPPESDGIGA